MIDNSMDRIIGDFIEINGDIISREYNSKLPKFIKSRIANMQRKKLLSNLDKFKNSNYILTWINIVELAYFVFNNFEPDHCFEEIKRVTVHNDRLEMLVEFEKYYHCLLYFDELPDFDNDDLSRLTVKFNLKMRYISESKNEGIDVYIDELSNDNRDRIRTYQTKLNEVLKECIYKYIHSVINKEQEYV